ncbi:MAG TPA: PorT family protein [Candidatus Cryptobacteroides pullicola]|nr:PorT family protein [Candidatus Cryptobacteroides pullicola]
MANDWKNKLRSEFEHYEEAEPEGLWAAVRDSLASADGLRGASVQGSRSSLGKRRHAPEQYGRRYARAAAFGSFAVAAALAVALIPDWGGRPSEPLSGEGFAALSASSVTSSASSGMDGLVPSGADNSVFMADGAEGDDSAFADLLSPERSSSAAGSPAKPDGSGESSVPGSRESVESVGTVVPGKSSGSGESAEPVDPAVPRASGESGGQLIFEDSGDFSTLDEDASRVSGRRKELSLKLAVASSSFSSTSHSGYGAMYGSSVAAFRFSATPVADDGYSAVLLKNNYQEVSTTSRHYLPVNVGFSLGWEFAPGFSLSAGVDYTCLVSDLSSGTDATRYETRQTLHYLGIPVTLEWSFVQRSRLRAYLYAGGQARKAVYGTSSTRYVIDSAPWEPVIEKIGETPLQWSAGAGAGVEYMLGDKVGLYAEPGLNYYFDNGSPVENVFKSRPMNFNLTLGLRLKL